jgi:2-amino-4-hydroxy-6-hydroxymethyldihydropteridine diphosphokinase
VNGSPQHTILGLGSNLGDRADIIAQAIGLLGKLPETRILAISEAVDSDPVGYADQPNFLNLCLAITCRFEPDELLIKTLEIERSSAGNGPLTRMAPGPWTSTCSSMKEVLGTARPSPSPTLGGLPEGLS